MKRIKCKKCAKKLLRNNITGYCKTDWGIKRAKPSSRWSKYRKFKCAHCLKLMGRGTKSDVCFECRKNSMEVSCDYCKTLFKRAFSEYVKRKKHFCSTKCAGLYVSQYEVGEKSRVYGLGQEKGILKMKNKARSELNHALRGGRIKKEPCVKCKLKKSEAHHPDYSKPLEVVWLCRRHHMDLHVLNGDLRRKNRKKPKNTANGYSITLIHRTSNSVV